MKVRVESAPPQGEHKGQYLSNNENGHHVGAARHAQFIVPLHPFPDHSRYLKGIGQKPHQFIIPNRFCRDTCALC